MITDSDLTLIEEVLVNDILSELFELFKSTHQKCAGYDGIVKKLIDEGECISTVHAKGTIFGLLDSFVIINDYSEGVDLVQIKFDRNSAIRSEVFYDKLNNRHQTSINLVEQLKSDLYKAEILHDTIFRTLMKIN